MEIEKKNGEIEEFDRDKIEQSITSAGVSRKTAREVAKRVKEKERMTSDDIRRTVIKELKKVDAEAAKRYEGTRCLMARKSIEAAKGVAYLSKSTMSQLKLKPGDNIDVRYQEERWTLEAQKDKDDESTSHNDICLNEEDITDFNLSEGIRLVVRRHR